MLTVRGISWALGRFGGIRVVLVRPQHSLRVLSSILHPLLQSVISFYIQRILNRSLSLKEITRLSNKGQSGHKGQEKP
jgi:hypothetical protein